MCKHRTLLDPIKLLTISIGRGGVNSFFTLKGHFTYNSSSKLARQCVSGASDRPPAPWSMGRYIWAHTRGGISLGGCICPNMFGHRRDFFGQQLHEPDLSSSFVQQKNPFFLHMIPPTPEESHFRKVKWWADTQNVFPTLTSTRSLWTITEVYYPM